MRSGVKAFANWKSIHGRPQDSGMTPVSLHVLLVDEHRTAKQDIVRSLQHGGYHPRCQRVGTMGTLRRALRHTADWDLVVCDTPLRELPLDPVLQLVRTTRPALPIVLVSSAAEREFESQFADGRVDGFVSATRLDDLAAMVAFLRLQRGAWRVRDPPARRSMASEARG
jgi:CheY-like chemotaxis protein